MAHLMVVLISRQSQKLYHEDKDLYQKIARKGSKALYFARSSQENETWVYAVSATPVSKY
jgi:hypothetical protein